MTFHAVNSVVKVGEEDAAGLGLLKSISMKCLKSDESSPSDAAAAPARDGDGSLFGVSTILACAGRTSMAGMDGIAILNEAAHTLQPNIAILNLAAGTTPPPACVPQWVDSLESGKGKKVCVTGASGFLGSHLVQQLLNHQYTVVGTVRDPSNAAKTSYLTSLPGAADRLKLVAADLNKEGSFDEAFAGVDAVFHVAFPVEDMFSGKVAPEDIEKSVTSTLNLLESCAKATSVKKLVLTSSTATMLVSDGPKKASGWSEEDWSDEAKMESKPYHMSKTKAEKAAWDFVKSKTPGFELVTLCPTMVIGPMLQPTLNMSCGWLKSLVDPSKTHIARSSMSVVDVRDVAIAHVLAYEVEGSSGRYPLVAQSMTIDHITAIVRRAAPFAQGPTTLAEGEQEALTAYDCSRIMSHGFNFTSAVCTIVDTVASLIANGHLKKGPAAAAAAPTPEPAASDKPAAIDPAKEEELKALFDTFDMEGEGFVTKEAFKDFYRSANNLLPDEETKLDEKLAECKEKGDQNVSFREFTAIMLAAPSA